MLDAACRKTVMIAVITTATATIATTIARGTLGSGHRSPINAVFMFGSVGAQEITAWFAEKGQDVHKSEVVIQDGPLRFVGKYTLAIECYAGVLATLPLILESDVVLDAQEEAESVTKDAEVEEDSDATNEGETPSEENVDAE